MKNENPTVPAKNERGEWLTRDGHVLSVEFDVFGRTPKDWSVYIYPDHRDMRLPWEPACDWEPDPLADPCDLRVDHQSSHAYGTTIQPRSTYAYCVIKQGEPVEVAS